MGRNALAVAAMALLSLWVMLPEARTMTEPFVDHAEQTIDDNVPLFLIAFLLAMGATVVSWLITRWPRREAPEPYRVIRRFRV